MYQKYISGSYNTACKGVSKYLKKTQLENLNYDNFLDNTDKLHILSSTTIQTDQHDNIVNKYNTKILGLGLIPTKRYFCSSGHSTTLSDLATDI